MFQKSQICLAILTNEKLFIQMVEERNVQKSQEWKGNQENENLGLKSCSDTHHLKISSFEYMEGGHVQRVINDFKHEEESCSIEHLTKSRTLIYHIRSCLRGGVKPKPPRRRRLYEEHDPIDPHIVSLEFEELNPLFTPDPTSSIYIPSLDLEHSMSSLGVVNNTPTSAISKHMGIIYVNQVP